MLRTRADDVWLKSEICASNNVYSFLNKDFVLKYLETAIFEIF